MRKLLVAFLLITAGFVLTACGGGSDSPETVAVDFVSAMYKGDINKMEKLIAVDTSNSQGEKEVISGKLKMAVDQAKSNAERKGGFKEVKIDNSEIDEPNGTGTIQMTVYFKNEGSDPAKDHVRVVRTEKGWKVKV